MPELSNIQTYEKLFNHDFQPTIDKFAKVLKQIDLWNEEIEFAFKSFGRDVEENGIGYSSIHVPDFYKTKYSNVLVRPSAMVYSKEVHDSFSDNWISCELFIETEELESYETKEYYSQTYDLIKNLAKEFAEEFKDTGVYFTNEMQDGEDFDGIIMKDQNKLWQFDYALIPNGLKNIYDKKPDSHAITDSNDYFESWHTERWKKMI